MDEQPCPFVNALLGGEHQCQHAREVTRRSGPAVLCNDETAHQRCTAVYENAKAAALPTLGYEDDLLSMPHSILVKVQFGTIHGLQQLADDRASVDDVGTLVATMADRHGGSESIPYTSLIPSIEQYRLPRRRRRT